MKNLRISFPLVNGESIDYQDYPTGRQLIQALTTDDWGAPPRSMVFEIETDEGQQITFAIPYNDSAKVFVRVTPKAL